MASLMRAPRLATLSLGVILSAVTFTQAGARAEQSPVVVKVGDTTVTATDLQRMIASVPAFQLRTFGSTPDEVRRNFLDRVVVRELLLSQAARADGYAKRPEVADRVRRIHRDALLTALREESADKKVTDAEVKAYYQQNFARYNAPPRIAIWRILVATKPEAEALLADLKKDLTPKHWNEVAREKSLDKATSMRGGALGFVGPDGTTAEPGVKVDPALIIAVATTQDGELVAEPVAEGSRWGVVWRRQSTKAVTRSVEDEALSIRRMLSQGRADVMIKETVAALRKAHLSGVHADLVDNIDIKSDGYLQPKPRPGVLPTSKPSDKPR